MFSGIVQAVGAIEKIEPLEKGVRLTIESGALDLSDVTIGDSIAVNGVCLTATSNAGDRFTADVSRETLDVTVGLGAPGICVQVKSGDERVDRPTLSELGGVMRNHGTDHGLLVSWGGFKSTVEKEIAGQFLGVRMWDARALVDSLLAQYDKLPESMRAKIPLKRIWVVAAEAEQQ